jgi:hypothetical protein
LKRQAKIVAGKAREVYNSRPGRVEEVLNNGPFERLEVKLAPRGDGMFEVRVGKEREREG